MSKLPKIFLNLDFYTKGRNLRWIQDNGIEAVAILQNVWIASSQERDFKIKKLDACALPFFLMFTKEKVIQVLESAVEVGLLESDGENYFNSQIVSHGKSFLKKHNNYVKSHEKRKRNQSKSIEDSLKNLDESSMDSIDTDIDTDIDLNKNKLSGQFCKLDDISAEQLQAANGAEIVARAVQIVDGWVEQAKSDPVEFRERKAKARHGVGPLKSWALSKALQQIEQEKRSKPKRKNLNGYGENHLENMRLAEDMFDEKGNFKDA